MYHDVTMKELVSAKSFRAHGVIGGYSSREVNPKDCP